MEHKFGKEFGKEFRQARRSVYVKAIDLANFTDVTKEQIWRMEKSHLLTTSVKSLLYLRAKGIDINALFDHLIEAHEELSALKKRPM